MKTREDIFKEINIRIAEEGFGPGDEFAIDGSPESAESAVRAAAYYIMVAERAITIQARMKARTNASKLDIKVTDRPDD